MHAEDHEIDRQAGFRRPMRGGFGHRVRGRAAGHARPQELRASLAARLLTLAVLLHAARPVSGQAPVPLTCDGLIVSSIEFASRDPSLTSLPSQLQGVARVVGLIHSTTDPGVLRHFLHLEVGEACTERRRAESERTLRVQPFLADVTVRAVPDGAGGVRIEVETTDEIPTILTARFRGIEPASLRFGHSNIAGEAISLSASAERGFGYRTGFGLSGVSYAAFGRPYTLALEGERDPLGSKLRFSLGHPFITDLQRTAWHLGYADVNAYLYFVPTAGDDVSLGVRRRLWDIGGVRRIALGRWSAFAGGLLTHEEVIPAQHAVIVSDSGLVADTSGAFAPRAPSFSHLRLNAVFGLRRLTYTPVRGFDALAGVQDMATGVQIATLFGWGIARAESREGDLFVSADLYAGLGAGRSFATLQAQGEARNDHTANRWDSMVGSGRLKWYLKPTDGHLLIATLAGGGAWRERVPFQLRLGDGEGGVRGYRGSRAAGGARVVGRLEERWVIGQVTRHALVGVATFAEAGRVWAGDAPFGTDSGTRVGLGVSLLAAFPPASQQLWRLDLAVPISSDPGARWEIRFSSRSARTPPREPRDVARARAGVASSAIFLWP